ncbi:MAG: transcriptional repressor [Chitinispirillaceae bacterium]|nr:transcriptional repressor [Chitinispirillaceae bacterium]
MNFRNSRQRQRILEVLRESQAHPTADWIYGRLKAEMPALSLGTVYRNLKVLTEQGKVNKLPFGSAVDRFDAQLSPHCHLVCERCGMVRDFTMPRFVDINRQAEKRSGFKISRHRIDFFGMCEKCSKADKKTNKLKP